MYRIEKGAGIKEGDKVVGQVSRLRTIKTKFGSNHRIIGTQDMFITGCGENGRGIDRVREMIQCSIDLDVLRKSTDKKGRIESSWDPDLYWAGEKRLRTQIRGEEWLEAELMTRLRDKTDELARENGHVW